LFTAIERIEQELRRIARRATPSRGPGRVDVIIEVDLPDRG
jgi:hypothetical protein